MLCIERNLVLLCLVAVINAVSLRDLFKRPSHDYDYQHRSYGDDDLFWQKYDNLNEVSKNYIIS